MGKELLGVVADVLFPPRCQACGETADELTAGLFCAACAGDIRYLQPPLCLSCGAPVPVAPGTEHCCPDCRREPQPFTTARSVAVYAGVLLQVIHDFKYRRRPSLGRGLGALMTGRNYAGIDTADLDVIIPVPLHVRRLRERGFNQSLLLARAVSAGCGVPLDFLSLRRERDTPPQTLRDRRERRANIRGAFGVTRRERIRGKKILLVDDVYTTGSTLAECARVLLDSDAARIDVLTLARAIPDAA
ncbi:MAG TPA: ComF family protein [Syntrophales bacterium]|nr:ComF family protein [Syntrophales bacterium]HON22845.1 ComF family protein [Syntrophales bacterium]HOU76882.1 ComF family protein [Syntrophales bacterium]HPC31651.1 ComF family protein [Syntrophales bacterium]HQG34294.1 ComF family protein [Syntrophales bacterium]